MLSEQINDDIKNAMRSKEKEKLEALRYLKAMFIENRTSLKPIEEFDVLVRHYKKLKDSIVNYPVGHVAIGKIEQELSFLEVYLPKALSEEEVVLLIQQIITAGAANMGAVMKELQPQIKGRFDGKKASDLVKSSFP